MVRSANTTGCAVQLDLEMAFATGEDVMGTVESLVKDLFHELSASYFLQQMGDELVPRPITSPRALSPWDPNSLAFPRITYDEAMTRYGSDKPDVRIPCEVSPLRFPKSSLTAGLEAWANKSRFGGSIRYSLLVSPA